MDANFRRISPSPDWGWNNWLHNVSLSGGAAQDLHIHDVDYVLSLFGEPNALYSVKNTEGETNAYVNTLMQFDSFAVGVEGTWDLPASHPFQASFRVVFEKAAAGEPIAQASLAAGAKSLKFLLEKELAFHA